MKLTHINYKIAKEEGFKILCLQIQKGKGPMQYHQNEKVY